MNTNSSEKFKNPLLNVLVLVVSAACLTYHIFRLLSGLAAMSATDKVLTFIYVICFLMIMCYAVFRNFRSSDFFTWMLIILGAVTLYTQVLFPVSFEKEWIVTATKVVALLVYGGLVAFNFSWSDVRKCRSILRFTLAGLLFNEIVILAMKMKMGDTLTIYAIFEAVSPLVILLNMAMCYNFRMNKKKPSQEVL